MPRLTFNGVIDVLAMKALIYAEASGKPREEALNAEQKERAETARTRLCEAVAETDDALLEKYLDKGVLEDDELRAALRAATIAGKLTPVLCGSGLKNIGIGPLLDAIDALLPAPNVRPARQGFAGANGEPVERAPDPAAPFSAFVFKTLIDPFAGKLSIFRVVSGRAQSDATVLNSTRGVREHFGQLLRLEGKKQSPISAALPGEIVAVAKLKDTTTCDTLCDEKSAVIFPAPERPATVMSFAIRPKTKGDEEKASQALQHLVEEDRALETHRDPQTHEIILSGTGQMHIEVTVEKLKRKFNVEVELQPPKVPYKETIKGRAEAQGKYKRQSGGRGQYGDCWLKVEPLARGRRFRVRRSDRRRRDSASVHSVGRKGDAQHAGRGISRRLSRWSTSRSRSTTAAITTSIPRIWLSRLRRRWASRAAFEKARPILLEPVMSVDVSCPDDCMGDVIGDLNSRRGRVLGMETQGPEPGNQGVGADGGDSEVRARPALDDFGPRIVRGAFLSLRGSAAADHREDGQGGARGP